MQIWAITFSYYSGLLGRELTSKDRLDLIELAKRLLRDRGCDISHLSVSDYGDEVHIFRKGGGAGSRQYRMLNLQLERDDGRK